MLNEVTKNHLIEECPTFYENAMTGNPCSIAEKRCYYNSYCCPMCPNDGFATCGYLHESICLNNQWNMNELPVPSCLNQNCEAERSCTFNMFTEQLNQLVPEACDTGDHHMYLISNFSLEATKLS